MAKNVCGLGSATYLTTIISSPGDPSFWVGSKSRFIDPNNMHNIPHVSIRTCTCDALVCHQLNFSRNIV